MKLPPPPPPPPLQNFDILRADSKVTWKTRHCNTEHDEAQALSTFIRCFGEFTESSRSSFATWEEGLEIIKLDRILTQDIVVWSYKDF